MTSYRIRVASRVVIVMALVMLTLVPSLVAARPATSTQLLQDKIAVALRDELAANGSAIFFVVMAQQADVSAAAQLTTKEAKGRYVYDTLQDMADRSQADLRASLDARGITYRSFFIRNMIMLQGDLALANEMALRADVASVEANTIYHMDLPNTPETPLAAPDAPEPGLVRIHAPEVWALGFNGQGSVVADADTGVQWDHPALQAHYRGWNGSTADHNYNWRDGTCATSAFNPPGNECTAPLVPADPHGHGTHTMGTMVGDDGGTNQIGVAPGAKWIACRNLNDQGWGARAFYADCFEFFIAPTDLNGNNANPALAPDVINNSWSCPPTSGGEDCNDPANDLLAEVNNTRAAGIVVAAAAANSGPSCGTIDAPIAIYDASYTVGAFSAATGAIASFSSRGPSVYTNLLKPDITAPGVSVRSSVPTNSYANFSGTSMATPHVAGSVALLWSARPGLRGNVDATEALFDATATPRTSTQDCGAVPGTNIPNNTWGYGEINVLAAVQQAPTALTLSEAGAQTQPTSAPVFVMAFVLLLVAAGLGVWQRRRAGTTAYNRM